MNNKFEFLKNYCGRYSGQGINHEGQAFTGFFNLQPILNGKGFTIQFSAVGTDGTLYHDELSTLAPGLLSEKLTIWNLNSNMPGLVPHELRETPLKSGAEHSMLFGFNPKNEGNAFREEIALDLWSSSEVSYTYSWGMPGAEFKERSGVRLVRMTSP